MERAVTVRPALPEDGQVLFAMNRAFNGEGVASPQEAALALAHPGSERVLLAFVAGEPAGFLCGLLKRSACYSRPSAEVTELYVCPGCRRQGVARQLLGAFLIFNTSAFYFNNCKNVPPNYAILFLHKFGGYIFEASHLNKVSHYCFNVLFAR